MSEATFLPYALADLDDREIEEVVASLKSGWITTGPKVKAFEKACAEYIGTEHALAVNSCTAGLHLALLAAGLKPGDEVITTPLTFAATVNTIIHAGGKPVLADIDGKTGNIDPLSIERKISSKTKVVMPVHYAGLSCDMEAIRQLASRHRLLVIEDAAHAMGCSYRGRKVGSDSFIAVFSFYPTKNMTTIEGGLLVTQDPEIRSRAEQLSLHGMSKDAWNRYNQSGSWGYDIVHAGFKYNMTDVQAAVGLHQLKKLNGFIERRRYLAEIFRRELGGLVSLQLPPPEAEGYFHTYHIFAVHLTEYAPVDRNQFIDEMKKRGIGTSVHYIPIPNHSYYKNTFGWQLEDFPNAKSFFQGLVSLPLYPKMKDEDVYRVCSAVKDILASRT